jgi:hypothetical protein
MYFLSTLTSTETHGPERNFLMYACIESRFSNCTPLYAHKTPAEESKTSIALSASKLPYAPV